MRQSVVDRLVSLQAQLGDDISKRMHRMNRSSMDEFELLDALKKAVGEEASGDKITILYASETGNTADLAKMLAYEMKVTVFRRASTTAVELCLRQCLSLRSVCP